MKNIANRKIIKGMSKRKSDVNKENVMFISSLFVRINSPEIVKKLRKAKDIQYLKILFEGL